MRGKYNGIIARRLLRYRLKEGCLPSKGDKVGIGSTHNIPPCLSPENIKRDEILMEQLFNKKLI